MTDKLGGSEGTSAPPPSALAAAIQNASLFDPEGGVAILPACDYTFLLKTLRESRAELSRCRSLLEEREGMLDRMVAQSRANATELERHAIAATAAFNISLRLLRELEASRPASSQTEGQTP